MRSRLAGTLVILAVLALSGRALALQVSFGTPAPSAIHAGQETSIPIWLQDVPSNLYSLSFYVAYDPAVLAFDPFPPPLGQPSFFDGLLGTQTSDAPGLVNVYVPYGDFTLLGPSFELTALNFIGIALGTSLVSFVSDPAMVYADLTDFTQITPVLGAPTNTDVVPEPGTMLLLGTGMAGLMGWRRRNSRRS